MKKNTLNNIWQQIKKTTNSIWKLIVIGSVIITYIAFFEKTPARKSIINMPSWFDLYALMYALGIGILALFVGVIIRIYIQRIVNENNIGKQDNNAISQNMLNITDNFQKQFSELKINIELLKYSLKYKDRWAHDNNKTFNDSIKNEIDRLVKNNPTDIEKKEWFEKYKQL